MGDVQLSLRFFRSVAQRCEEVMKVLKRTNVARCQQQLARGIKSQGEVAFRSEESASEMTGSSLIIIAATTTTLCLILHCGNLAAAHYTDDSDYGDLNDYKELPEKRLGNSGYQFYQDDFYIVNEPEENEDRNRRVAGVRREDVGISSGPVNSQERANTQSKWASSERVYRYTKHRIPGYDYDELDLLESRKYQRCDDRSVWTHCLCQFTCVEPNIVDCYTPCTSGCECREDFVYDERTKQCVLPEECQPNEDYFLY